MRYIKDISEDEKKTLEEGSKNSKKAHFRRRCDSILLSNRGKSVSYIAGHFAVPRKTVYRWFTRWQRGGISGLLLQKGRGLKAVLDSIIDETLAQELKSSIALNPQKLSGVAADLSEKTSNNITYGMLKRFIKKHFNYTWKRLKKWPQRRTAQAQARPQRI